MALDATIRASIEATPADQRTAEEAALLAAHTLSDEEAAALRAEIVEGDLYAGKTAKEAWAIFRDPERPDPDAPQDAPAFLESRRHAVMGTAGKKVRFEDIAALIAERAGLSQ